MKPFELLDQTISPDGSVMKLVRRDDEYFILADGATLMSSRMHGSEESLAALACERARTLPHASVLIGGLGMGFTLRATLDLLAPEAAVHVSELIPAVIEWNRGPLGPLAGNPLQDHRARVAVEDVAAMLAAHPASFDAVLLDVDNGPAAFTTTANSALYGDRGIAAAFASLKPNGVLAIWAARDDRKFTQRLRAACFHVHVHHVRARAKQRGPRHTIYVCQKPNIGDG